MRGSLARGSSCLPDWKFIRRRIPIDEVAARLGLRGNGRYFYCWRQVEQHGERRATVGVHVPSNTVRCFRCGPPSLAPVDLVMAVRGIDVGDAFRWFAQEYPDLPKIRSRMTTNKWGITKHAFRGYMGRPWPELSCDALVLSPAWAKLTHASRALAAAIVARVPREPDVHPLLTSCYPQLQAWTGIGNRRTLARALRELQTIGFIQTALTPTGRETCTGRATYQTLIRLTCWSRRFHDWLVGNQPRRKSVRVRATATQYTVAELPLRWREQNATIPLRSWKPAKGARVQ